MKKNVVKVIEIVMGTIYAAMMYCIAGVVAIASALACALGILAGVLGGNENESVSRASRIGMKFPGVQWINNNFEIFKDLR